MTESKTTDTVLTYEDEVITKIAGNTVRDVDGVLSLKGNVINSMTERLSKKEVDPSTGVKVDLDNDEEQVKLAMDAVLEYGKSIPTIFSKIVKRLEQSIGELTDLKPTEIKINVVDLLTRREYDEKNNKVAEPKAELAVD